MPQPSALAEWRAANALAIDCRELAYEGSRVQCPHCKRWVGSLLAVTGKGLHCVACAKRALGRFAL